MNFFDYAFTFLVPIILVFVTIKYFIFIAKLLRYKRAQATVLDIKSSKYPFIDKYIYSIILNLGSTTIIGELKGYTSPFIFSKDETVPVLVDRKDAKKILPFTLKGKLISLLLKLLIYILLVLGTLVGAAKLSFLELNDIVFDFILVIFVTLPFIMLINRIVLIRTLLKNSGKTNGIIKGYKESLDSDNLKTYVPIIEFTDINSRTISFTSSKHYYDMHGIGNKVKVVYNKSFPEFAEIDSAAIIWIEAIFWIITLLLTLIYMWIG